jgi:hypothetical protein
VCGRESFDRARPKPYGYVILNRAGTHAAFVRASDSAQWRVESRRDSRYQGDLAQEFYFSPLPLVQFFKLKGDNAPAAATQSNSDEGAYDPFQELETTREALLKEHPDMQH